MSDLATANKSFLSRPEGKTGILIGGAALLAGGYGLFVILPTLIVLLENTIYAAALMAALAFIVFVVSDKRIRTLASYGWKSAMRALTGLVIEIDPIGILRGYLQNLQDGLESMDKAISNLAGQIKKLNNIIQKNEDDRIHALKIAQAAKGKADMKNVFTLRMNEAGRKSASNLTLQGLLNKMQNLMRVLSKMREASDFMIQDITSEVEVKTQERNALMAGYSAFKSARNIIAGESDQKQIFDMTMEKLTDDYAMKVGEIENFMQVSDGFIKGVDLENGIYEADAMKQLDEWEKKSQNLLVLDNSKFRVEDTSAPEEHDDGVTEKRQSFADNILDS